MQANVEWVFFGIGESSVLSVNAITKAELHAIDHTLVKSMHLSTNELRKCAATILLGIKPATFQVTLPIKHGIKFNISAYDIYGSDGLIGYFLLLNQQDSKQINSKISELSVKHYFTDQVIPSLDDAFKKCRLKEKTLQVIKMTALGLNSAEIADVLHLTSRGVDYHLDVAKQALKATNKPNLVFEAKALGWF